MDDIRAFIRGQAPTTLIAVGYMQNGTVSLAQNFTQDHAAASKSLRLPQGFIGAEASPYFSLTDFIKRWPANPSLPRREVLMITSGIDTFYGGGYPDPYVDTAVQDAQCAGIVVFSIYTPGAGQSGTPTGESTGRRTILLSFLKKQEANPITFWGRKPRWRSSRISIR
jgi:hypothetical protein